MSLPGRVVVSWDALGSRLHRFNWCCRGIFHVQFWLFSFHRCWNQVSLDLLLISNRHLGNIELLCKMVLGVVSTVVHLPVELRTKVDSSTETPGIHFGPPLKLLRLCKLFLLPAWWVFWHASYVPVSEKPGFDVLSFQFLGR